MASTSAKANVVVFKEDAEDSDDGEGKRPNSMCFAFLKGECTRGDECRFYHNEYGPHHGRGKAQKMEEVCRNFMRGDCSYGDKCRFQHAAKGGNSNSNAAGNKRRRHDDDDTSNGKRKDKVKKPKHLSRKLAQASFVSDTELTEKLEEERLHLLAVKSESKEQWKNLVQKKLQASLEKRVQDTRIKLESVSGRKGKVKDALPVDTVKEAEKTALLATLKRLNTWNQESFDTKFDALTAKGLSREVFLREIGVDVSQGAKAAKVKSGVATVVSTPVTGAAEEDENENERQENDDQTAVSSQDKENDNEMDKAIAKTGKGKSITTTKYNKIQAKSSAKNKSKGKEKEKEKEVK